MVIGFHNVAPLEVAAVMAPVAIYFLVLGLLNSRGRPQLLSGRLDFSILTVALSPLFLLPLLSWLGPSPLALGAAAAVLGGGAFALAPRGRNWVVYNVQVTEARSAVVRALRKLGLEFREEDSGYALDGAAVRVGAFAPLRNATIRLVGGDRPLARSFEKALGEVLRSYEAQTSPMAVSLLLVATAMLVAPLALMAHRVPDVVRLLTDFIK